MMTGLPLEMGAIHAELHGLVVYLQIRRRHAASASPCHVTTDSDIRVPRRAARIDIH